jgi:hypothetical protein
MCDFVCVLEDFVSLSLFGGAGVSDCALRSLDKSGLRSRRVADDAARRPTSAPVMAELKRAGTHDRQQFGLVGVDRGN